MTSTRQISFKLEPKARKALFKHMSLMQLVDLAVCSKRTAALFQSDDDFDKRTFKIDSVFPRNITHVSDDGKTEKWFFKLKTSERENEVQRGLRRIGRSKIAFGTMDCENDPRGDVYSISCHSQKPCFHWFEMWKFLNNTFSIKMNIVDVELTMMESLKYLFRLPDCMENESGHLRIGAGAVSIQTMNYILGRSSKFKSYIIDCFPPYDFTYGGEIVSKNFELTNGFWFNLSVLMRMKSSTVKVEKCANFSNSALRTYLQQLVETNREDWNLKYAVIGGRIEEETFDLNKIVEGMTSAMPGCEKRPSACTRLFSKLSCPEYTTGKDIETNDGELMTVLVKTDVRDEKSPSIRLQTVFILVWSDPCPHELPSTDFQEPNGFEYKFDDLKKLLGYKRILIGNCTKITNQNLHDFCHQWISGNSRINRQFEYLALTGSTLHNVFTLSEILLNFPSNPFASKKQDELEKFAHLPCDYSFARDICRTDKTKQATVVVQQGGGQQFFFFLVWSDENPNAPVPKPPPNPLKRIGYKM